MTQTDDILLELDREAARYVKGVSPFEYKNKSYHLIDNYVAVPYMKCDFCGGYPTYEVSVIESDDGKRLRMGNDCIDHLTGQKVAEWFKNFRRKRENAMANRKSIDEPITVT